MAGRGAQRTLVAAMVSLLGLDPSSYKPSRLHHPDRTFRETNCYLDLWIELLHARNVAPESVMSCACGVDFEGDQWTFFKPSPEDLLRLHGIDVHEMQLYRPIVEHATDQLQAGRTMTIEVDSFYLPDTEGASYRKAHVKSSIAVEAISPEGERLRYFHGTGYYELQGEDYRGVFRLGRTFSEDVLPPYVELVNFHSGVQFRDEALRRGAMESLRRVISRRSRTNPWLAFGERLIGDLPKLLEGSENQYHAYAFATVRQCGAAFEIAKSFVEWLAPASVAGLTAATALDRQVTGAKTLLFKLARRKAFDPRPAVEQLAGDWDTAMSALNRLAVGAEGRAA